MPSHSILSLSMFVIIPLLFASCAEEDLIAETQITKWQDNKTGAVTITFDDGSPNQFRNALPILNDLGQKATFFICTGEIEDSENQSAFIGRSMDDIIQETETIATNEDNFYERASAVRFLGYKGTWDYHIQGRPIVRAWPGRRSL